MTAPAHTPGPWKAWVGDDGAFEISASLPNEGHRGILCTRGPWSTRSEASCANGHLIAAAPDAIELARQVACEFADAKHPGSMETRLRDMALAIIAKAEGRA